jgi:hypothetical protein
MKSNLEYALAYADKGWMVFPCWEILEDGSCACGKECKSKGKHPISHLAPKGQDSSTTDKELITKWWTHRSTANIAVYLAGSGLMAVDIDPRNGGDWTIEDLESIHGEVTSDVTAFTGGGGEHRVFLKPEGTLAGTLGKGIDLKMNGYIIVEPSNHVSGGSYEWESGCNPLEGAIAPPLPDWIRSHSVGQGHADNRGVGVITNFGMSDEQYYDVIDALKFIPSDDRDVWVRVGLALHTANDKRSYGLWCDWASDSDKFDQADQYRVWRSFRHNGLRSVDMPTIFHMAQNNGWINTKKVEQVKLNTDLSFLMDDDRVVVVEDVAPPVAYKPTKPIAHAPIPELLQSFPVPILNEVSEWVEGFSRQPQEQITMFSTIALASTLCGRNYCSEEGNTSSLFLMILGETGIGKNYAKTSIQKFLSEVGMTDLLSGSGNTSAGAVYTSLVEAPCHIQIIDEIGKQLQSARKQPNGMMTEAFSILVESYSSTTNLLTPKNYSNMGAIASGKAKDAKKIVIHCPAITLLGLATPAQVYDSLTTVEIEDGFLNRLCVVEATMPLKPKQRQKRVGLPEHINQWARLIRNPVPTSLTSLVGIETGYASVPNQKTVVFNDDAYDLFDLKGDELQLREEEGEFVLPDMTRRWVENAMRLATCLAVCENALNPIITLKLAHWSMVLVEYYGNEFMLNAAAKVSDSDFHSLYLKVAEFIGRAGDKGMSEGELSQRCRAYAATAPHQRDQVLAALVREGKIQQFNFKTPSGRGRPKQSWVAVDCITQELLDKCK